MSIYGGKRRPIIFWLAKLVAQIVFPFFFKINAVGLEYLPQDGSFILLPKHQRWEDIPILGLVVQRSLYYIAKYELFINPVSSFFISSMGGVPLNRKKPRESQREIINMLDKLLDGEGVVIFPEGTYFEGHMGPGKTGLLRMIKSNLAFPFIPVGINIGRWAQKRFKDFGDRTVGKTCREKLKRSNREIFNPDYEGDSGIIRVEIIGRERFNV